MVPMWGAGTVLCWVCMCWHVFGFLSLVHLHVYITLISVCMYVCMCQQPTCFCFDVWRFMCVVM